jgi:RNA-directed DNA polymerase
MWQRSLSRRSQQGSVIWERMNRSVDKWLPVARIYHPYPDERLGVMTRGKSPVR